MSLWLKHTTPIGDCLNWTRCINTDGYPRAVRKGNCNLKLHREVFYDTYGYYPEVVRHSCDNILCLNPQHLLPGTNLDNVKDRVERGRTHNHVSDEEVDKVFDLRTQLKTYKQISETLNIKIRRVEYILTRVRKES